MNGKRFACPMTLAILSVAVWTVPASAQRGPGRAPGGGGRQGNRAQGPTQKTAPQPTGRLQLLLNRSVQEELGLTEEQIAAVLQLSNNARKRAQAIQFRSSGYPATNRKGSQEKTQREMQEIRAWTESEVEQTLKAPQLVRLLEIGGQLQLKEDVLGALTSEDLRKELGIEDAQEETRNNADRDARERMQEGLIKLQEEFNEKKAALEEQRNQEIIEALTPVQQEKLRKMLGEPFKMVQEPATGAGGGMPGRQGNQPRRRGTGPGGAMGR